MLERLNYETDGYDPRRHSCQKKAMKTITHVFIADQMLIGGWSGSGQTQTVRTAQNSASQMKHLVTVFSEVVRVIVHACVEALAIVNACIALPETCQFIRSKMCSEYFHAFGCRS